MQGTVGSIRSFSCGDGCIRHWSTLQSMIRKSGNRFSRTSGFVCSEIMLKPKHKLDGEDFLFLGRKQLIDLRNRPVGRFLHISGQTLLIVLGNLVVLFELLDGVKTVAADVPNRDFCPLG